MRLTDRGYKIPEKTDTLEASLEMFQETLQRVNDEQNAQDKAVKEAKKQKRKVLICSALGYNPWEFGG
jgi:peptidoglycan hydrolase CwlO-like protein